MPTPKDIQEFLAGLSKSPEWKEAEESGGQCLAELVTAAWEKRKREEEQAGLLEISLGETRYRYPVKDMDKVGAYIAEQGKLPIEWKIKEYGEE